MYGGPVRLFYAGGDTLYLDTLYLDLYPDTLHSMEVPRVVITPVLGQLVYVRTDLSYPCECAI